MGNMNVEVVSKIKIYREDIMEKVRMTIKYATEIYNFAMKMYRKEGKKGINISVIKKWRI